MLQNRCVRVCRAEQERHRSVSAADTPPKCSDLFDQSLKTNTACAIEVFLMFWNEYKTCFMTIPSHEPQTVTRLRAFGRPGTHLTEDGEGFGQSLAQQADPLGKQLVQMFPEMLADKEHS